MEKYIAMLEDDKDDRYITQETLNELGIPLPVRFFNRSNELFSYLEQAERPALFLIDYNVTPDNGLQVLRKLKAHSYFNDIPVVILSDSDNPKDKKQCYAEGASSFIRKPVSHAATHNKIATFFKYWMEVAEV